MTDSEKNQAIADKCPGRFEQSPSSGAWYWRSDTHGWVWCLNGSIIDDLNAMAVAEEHCLLAKGTDYSRWERYDNALFAVCGGFSRAHATSHQRADAFAKVFNLW